MKKLYLIRHALPISNEIESHEIQKTLSSYGITDTNNLLNYLKQQSVVFDHIITSHKARAFVTAKMIAQTQGFDLKSIVTDKRILHARTDDFFDMINQLDSKVSNVAIIGHNPPITIFANKFFNDKIKHLDNSSIAAIAFNTDNWMDVGSVPFQELFFHNPIMY